MRSTLLSHTVLAHLSSVEGNVRGTPTNDRNRPSRDNVSKVVPSDSAVIGIDV